MIELNTNSALEIDRAPPSIGENESLEVRTSQIGVNQKGDPHLHKKLGANLGYIFREYIHQEKSIFGHKSIFGSEKWSVCTCLYNIYSVLSTHT